MKSYRKFEVLVEKTLKREILNREKFLFEDYTVKGLSSYYSPYRERLWKADVAIEIWKKAHPDRWDPDLIWIIECKSGKRSIDVGEIAKFKERIDSIPSDKVVGTLITPQNGRVQAGAVRLAHSNNIGLIKITKGKQFELLKKNPHIRFVQKQFDIRYKKIRDTMKNTKCHWLGEPGALEKIRLSLEAQMPFPRTFHSDTWHEYFDAVMQDFLIK